MNRAYKGYPTLIDYSATKGAIVTFTRNLSANLVSKGIRVNAVAPGPIWTPLITSSSPDKKLSEHGAGTPMKRAGSRQKWRPPICFWPVIRILAISQASVASKRW